MNYTSIKFAQKQKTVMFSDMALSVGRAVPKHWKMQGKWRSALAERCL